jgi:hypothetical protein
MLTASPLLVGPHACRTLSRADFLRLRTSRWRYLGLVILLGLYFAQSVASSAWHSVTFDEQYHITPGYVYLTQRDLRFHHDQNPPLFRRSCHALLSRSTFNSQSIIRPISCGAMSICFPTHSSGTAAMNPLAWFTPGA